jgi:hypothetical protein
MRHHQSMRFLAALAALLLSSMTGNSEEAKVTRPLKVVDILADDLGWAELGCFGNRFNETPNVDRLAVDGMRFTDAYAAAPVCSPYRAALMSGQCPARVGVTDYLRPDTDWQLFDEILTMAETLQSGRICDGHGRQMAFERLRPEWREVRTVEARLRRSHGIRADRDRRRILFSPLHQRESGTGDSAGR